VILEFALWTPAPMPEIIRCHRKHVASLTTNANFALGEYVFS